MRAFMPFTNKDNQQQREEKNATSLVAFRLDWAENKVHDVISQIGKYSWDIEARFRIECNQ